MAEDNNAGESIRIGSFKLPLPRSRLLRIAIGGVLIFFGVFGFLPVLGFWMIPAGLLILSVDVPRVRRWRRRFAVWFSRKYPNMAARLHVSGNGGNGNGSRKPVGS
jgi:hypothetical protein